MLGVPERVSEVLKVQVAHFEPVPVAIRGEGVFPAVVLTLPRVEDAGFAAALRQAQEQQERTMAVLRCGAERTAMQSVLLLLSNMPTSSMDTLQPQSGATARSKCC